MIMAQAASITEGSRQMVKFPIEPISPADASALSGLLDQYRSRYGGDSIVTIHPDDEMFKVLSQNAPVSGLAETVKCYVESGVGLLNDLDRIYADIGFSWDRVGRFLDFACG